MQHASPAIRGFSLVVERGQTRFPTRPIETERFLIGAGSNCQLQLGGDVPILHSIILPQADHLWIDAVVAAPPLLVNGQIVRESELRAGDLVEVAGFVFSIQRSEVSAETTTASLPEVSEISVTEPQTTSELVDALAADMELLEDLEHRKQQGLAALLEAARQTVPTEVTETTSIQQMLQELRARSAELDAREAALTAAAQELAESQRRLKEQIDQLLGSRIAEPSLRKTA